jgi:hypothetical protein
MKGRALEEIPGIGPKLARLVPLVRRQWHTPRNGRR